MKHRFRLLLVIILVGKSVLTAQTITNFTTAKTIYDFASIGTKVWVGTSGGLFIYDLATKASFLRPTGASFPDPSIRAVAVDDKGYVWAGSHDGYLLRRDGRDNEYINYSYVSANWHISDIAVYNDFLIIGSDKGVSLFDTKKLVVLKNAQHISTYPSSQVYTVTTFKNRLYIGGESGSAYLKITLDKISSANFFDPTLWQIDSSVAPVHSFYVENDKLFPSTGLTGTYQGVRLTAFRDSMEVRLNEGPDTVGFPSEITAIGKAGAATTLIGTEEFFFWCWGATDYYQVIIPGPTFASANRVHVARDGKLWVLPYGLEDGRNWYPEPWWLGINSFDGKSWWNFSPSYIYEMGHMASSTEALAIAQTKDDRMWFGFKGGSIKAYDPKTNRWMHYCNFGQSGDGDGTFIKREGPCPSFDWAKCDAIAQDSAGYMWISSWNNSDGVLLCYKPSPEENEDLEGRYKRFPPKGHMDLIVNISAIAADRNNEILYGTETGVLSVITYSGDPITNGITPLKEFTNLQKIYRIVVLGDGTSLVLAASGVHIYNPEDRTLAVVEEFEKGITVLAAENDNLFWYGVGGKGVVRFDFLNNEKKLFSSAQGLASNQINDLFVDKKNGCVWVATDRGVSRIALGYVSAADGSEPSIQVYPNPFSRKRHTAMYFRNVPREAVVSVHALNGNLVGKPALVIKGDGGAFYQWKPPAQCAAGTYFYAVVAPSEKKSGKIMIVP